MFEKMKERAREREEARAEQERAERARLTAMSEKELLVELILEIRKLNDTVTDEANNIRSTVRMGNNW